MVCLHKYRGQSKPQALREKNWFRTEAEERARAFSLQKHLSKARKASEKALKRLKGP